MEHIKVPRVQKKTLRGQESFPQHCYPRGSLSPGSAALPSLQFRLSHHPPVAAGEGAPRSWAFMVRSGLYGLVVEPSMHSCMAWLLIPQCLEGFQQFTELSHSDCSDVRQETSDLEGRGCRSIGRICRPGILNKVYQDLILHDIPRRSCAQSLVSCTSSTILRSGCTPEAIAVQLHSLAGLFGV